MNNRIFLNNMSKNFHLEKRNLKRPEMLENFIIIIIITFIVLYHTEQIQKPAALASLFRIWDDMNGAYYKQQKCGA